MNAREIGRFSFIEIRNQPDAWTGTLQLVEEKANRLKVLVDGVDEVIFAGCGSALNAALAIAPAFQSITGIRTRAVPAAECVFFPETVFTQGGRTLFVAISRSGDTTETVLACNAAQARELKSLSITCYPQGALARRTTETLVLEPAVEKAVVATRSMTSMVLSGQAFAAVASGNKDFLTQLNALPEIGRKVIEKCYDLGKEIGENESIRKFAFVGSGPFYGLARECQLKLKEMTLLPSDSYPVLDFRHGPKSIVDEHTLVTLLMSDRAFEEECKFLQEMKELGGSLLATCDQASPEVVRTVDYLVEVQSGLSEFARGILYLPVVQFLAYYRSLLQGQDPDNPRNLTYYVALR